MEMDRTEVPASSPRAWGSSVLLEDAPKGPKVLFVATGYGHLKAFHLPFMRLLQMRGCQVHAAASPGKGGKSRAAIAGVTCWDVPFSRSPLRVGNLRAGLVLLRLLRQEGYALIHVHTPVAAWITRWVARSSHETAVLYTVHGFHFYSSAPPLYWLLYYPAERLAARWTDGLVVMNDEDWTRAQRMGFVPGKDLWSLIHDEGRWVAAQEGLGVSLGLLGVARQVERDERVAGEETLDQAGLPGLAHACQHNHRSSLN